jgi:hypothetical protein
MDVILAGIATEVKAEQPSKTRLSMDVIPFDRTMDVRLEHSEKA